VYARNVGSNRYKTAVSVQGPGVNFIPGIYEPRTVGINLNARF
jgi:hypothetical protein